MLLPARACVSMPTSQSSSTPLANHLKQSEIFFITKRIGNWGRQQPGVSCNAGLRAHQNSTHTTSRADPIFFARSSTFRACLSTPLLLVDSSAQASNHQKDLAHLAMPAVLRETPHSAACANLAGKTDMHHLTENRQACGDKLLWSV